MWLSEKTPKSQLSNVNKFTNLVKDAADAIHGNTHRKESQH